MSRWYKKQKQEFDDMVYGYLVKRLKSPIESSDAFHTGSIDEFGNEMKEGTSWAYTKLDKLIIQLKAALGKEGIKNIADDFSDVDSYSLMQGAVDTKDYRTKYDGIVSLVEECEYLPPEQRGKGDYIEPKDDLTKDERIQRALTCASYLMYAMKHNDDIPNEGQFNEEVLPSVEATFCVRSIGTCAEISDYLRKGGVIDYKTITKDGYILAARLAKWIVAHDLCANGMNNVDNMCKSWRTLACVGSR